MEKATVHESGDTIRGRYVVAKRAFMPGEVAMSSRPFSAVLSSSCHAERCSECWSRCSAGEQLRRCSACKCAFYDSTSCQRAHWKSGLMPLGLLPCAPTPRNFIVSPLLAIDIRAASWNRGSGDWAVTLAARRQHRTPTGISPAPVRAHAGDRCPHVAASGTHVLPCRAGYVAAEPV